MVKSRLLNVANKPPDIYKCIKTSLKCIVKHQEVIDVLQNSVDTMNRIVIHTLQFLKLYLINEYDTKNTIPIVDDTLIKNIMKILCLEKQVGRPPKKETVDLKKKLKHFYDTHYKHLIDQNEEQLTYEYLNNVIEYTSGGLVTVLETNIKQHYFEYINRYINVFFNKKDRYSTLETEDEKKSFIKMLRDIKNDVLNVDLDNTPYRSSNDLHSTIDVLKRTIIPLKTFEKNNIHYDIQCSPQDYLVCAFRMMRYIEEKEETIYNILPLRRSVIPKYIKIDTTTIVNLLIKREKHGIKSFYLTKGNLVKYEHKIWKFFFNLKNKAFKKKGYFFNYMIETDGVGVSLQLIRDSHKGRTNIKIPKVKLEETYIDDIEDTEPLKNKNVVSIDLNKRDLMFCNDGNKTFRYTQNQRVKETKSKKFSKIKQKKSDETIIDGKSVKEWETTLSGFNHKTLNFDTFKSYVQQKNNINHRLINYYKDYLFRKLRLNSFINTMTTENNLVNRFMKKFGSPDDTIVCIGNWSQTRNKYNPSTKGKGFRTMFRKKGYEVYLVDEYNTSCRCFNCQGGLCKPFRDCVNPRPWKTNIIKRHGLLMCQHCKENNSLWNRDVNASLNILRISKDHINYHERPKYLQRG